MRKITFGREYGRKNGREKAKSPLKVSAKLMQNLWYLIFVNRTDTASAGAEKQTTGWARTNNKK